MDFDGGNQYYATSFLQRSEVICGRFDLSASSEPTEQRLRIVAGIRHPGFDASGSSSANDIALVNFNSMKYFLQSRTKPFDRIISDSIGG